MKKLYLLTLMFVGSVISLNAQLVPLNGLIAYYPFDGNTNDVSSNSNNAVNNGAQLSTDRFGNFNSAYQFDGQDDYMDAGNILNVSDQSGITLAMWIYPEAISPSINRYVGLSFGTKLTGELTLRVASETFTVFNAVLADGSNISSNGNGTGASSSSFNYNQWYHIAATFENQEVSLFVNGIKIATNTGFNNSGGMLSHVQPNADFLIGKAFNTNNEQRYFRGKMDDALVYNRVLTDCEIRQIYGEDVDLDDGLVAFYPFNGNANDMSGNGNNAGVIGASLSSDRNGIPNSAYDFDGINDYITTFRSFDYQYRTVSGWVFARDISGNGIDEKHAFGQDATSLQYGQVKLKFSNNNFEIRSGGEVSNFVYSASSNLWYNVILVRENNLCSYFINNQLVGSANCGSIASSLTPNPIFLIGTGRTTNNQFFNGLIDDLRIYNRAFNDCEVKGLFDPTSIVGIDSTLVLCGGDSLVLQSGLNNVEWYRDFTFVDNGNSLRIAVTDTGAYIAEGLDSCGCLAQDKYEIKNNQRESQFYRLGKCKQDSFLLSNSDNLTDIKWFKNGVLFASNVDSVIIRDTVSTLITLIATTEIGCAVRDTFLISSINPISEVIAYDKLICPSTREQREYSLVGNGFSQFNWEIQGGSINSNDGLSVNVTWNDLMNAELSVYEITPEGCIGDTINFEFEIDSSDIELQLISYAENFQKLNFLGKANAFDTTKSFKLISNDFDSTFFLDDNLISVEIDTSEIEEVNAYSFSVLDRCLNENNSNEALPITLSSELDSLNGQISIYWNNYLGWNDDNIKNKLFELKGDGSRKFVVNNGNINELKIPYNLSEFKRCFYLESENDILNLLSRSNLECLEIRGGLFIPNVITPNNDGFNDCLVIPNLEKFDNSELIIYNRYGQIVLKESNYNMSWCAENVPSGVYFYHLLLNNREINFKGFLEVLK